MHAQWVAHMLSGLFLRAVLAMSTRCARAAACVLLLSHLLLGSSRAALLAALSASIFNRASARFGSAATCAARPRRVPAIPSWPSQMTRRWFRTRT
eukprot:m.111009 g.111009  ORF g.111009 m.111009 type:complete len:96 (+) comp9076_c0_seq1:158-445(+)